MYVPNTTKQEFIKKYYGGMGQKFLAPIGTIRSNSPTGIAPNYINKGLFYSSTLKLQNKPLFI